MDPTLYSGGAGVVLAFLEGYRHFGDERWADRARRGARGLAAGVDGWTHRSLYFGTTGMAVALRAVADEFQDREVERSAARAIAAVRASFDGERWGPRSISSAATRASRWGLCTWVTSSWPSWPSWP